MPVTGPLSFGASAVLAFLVMRKKRISPLSSYGTFFLLSAIYTVFPIAVGQGLQPGIFMNSSLNFRDELIDTHLLVCSLANCAYAFGTAVFLDDRAHEPTSPDIKSEDGSHLRILQFIFFAGAIALTILGAAHPWGTDRGELVNSVLGQGKVLLSGLYAYYIAKVGVRRTALLMLAAMAVLTAIEGSRTSLIAMTLGTMIVAYADGAIGGLKVAALAVVGFVFFVMLAIVRVERSPFELGALVDVAFPLFIEGTYGSYMNLQVLEIFGSSGAAPTLFLNYFVDPLVFVIPRVLFVAVGLQKDEYTIFGSWVTSHAGVLVEEFAPYGGFYFVAEASAAMPYLGPIVIAFAFAWFSSWIWNQRSGSQSGRTRWVTFAVSFSLVFLKHTFAASLAMYVTCVLGVVLGRFLESLAAGGAGVTLGRVQGLGSKDSGVE